MYQIVKLNIYSYNMYLFFYLNCTLYLDFKIVLFVLTKKQYETFLLRECAKNTMNGGGGAVLTFSVTW